jgi:hypothetical protein
MLELFAVAVAIPVVKNLCIITEMQIPTGSGGRTGQGSLCGRMGFAVAAAWVTAGCPHIGVFQFLKIA